MLNTCHCRGKEIFLEKETLCFQVKCIVLRDAQSCNMESLCNCPELQSLALHNCGLLAVEGLEKCTEMQELYLEVSDFL